MQYGTAYPRIPFIDAASLEAVIQTGGDYQKALTQVGMMRKHSRLVSQPCETVSPGSASPVAENALAPSRPDETDALRLPRIFGPLPLPFFPKPSLRLLKIGYWTKVQISDDLAANLISFYLETEHSILGVFDADLFLDDLVNCRLEFCSAFLVSAILLLACVCNPTPLAWYRHLFVSTNTCGD